MRCQRPTPHTRARVCECVYGHAPLLTIHMRSSIGVTRTKASHTAILTKPQQTTKIETNNAQHNRAYHPTCHTQTDCNLRSIVFANLDSKSDSTQVRAARTHARARVRAYISLTLRQSKAIGVGVVSHRSWRPHPPPHPHPHPRLPESLLRRNCRHCAHAPICVGFSWVF